jgi:serine/threonine protein kinase
MDSPILVAELGSGGMAEVFLAMRRGMGGFVKLVVVKRLRTNTIESDAVAMFHDEARISARLNHPNVVQTHEVGFDGEHYRLEMEYLDGQPLHRITHRAKHAGRKISFGVAVAVIQDVLAGLQYAHDLKDYDGSTLGIVHRDVSPQNIFVTYDGRVKLVDFGIAKASGQMSVTQLGMVKGKTRYMAPEQATGQPVDARADVFATGIVLWQLLVGKGYWGDADDMAIFNRITNAQLPPGPRSQNPEVPEDLDAVCAKALAYDPIDRYASAEEFIRALDGCNVAERNALVSLGTLAAELFAEVRAKIKADIEKAAARPAATTEPPKETLPQLSDTDDNKVLAPSERPVSGSVRIPERRSHRSIFGIAIAAVIGGGIAIAAMKSAREPATTTQASRSPDEPHLGTPTPSMTTILSSASPVAMDASVAAPPTSASTGAIATARSSGGTQGTKGPVRVVPTATSEAVVVVPDAGVATSAQVQPKKPPSIDQDDDPWKK